MAISLTEAAARHVTRYLGKRGKGVGVRLGVKTTGCSGLAYKLEYVDEIAPEDIVFEEHGVKVLIDPKSLAYIDGTQLDFVREGLNEGFKFNNPNERDRCGCGESSACERRRAAPTRTPTCGAGGFCHRDMNLNLQSSDFELFGLPEQFAQDRAAIDARWKELQREAHPDKFAAQGQAAQRVAMQWSVRINEAYQRLKEPAQARLLPVRAARSADQCGEQHGHARATSWWSRWRGARRWKRRAARTNSTR